MTPSLPSIMHEIIMRRVANIKHIGMITSIQALESIINNTPPIINNVPNADVISIQNTCSIAVMRSVGGKPNVAAPSVYDRYNHQEMQTPAITTNEIA